MKKLLFISTRAFYPIHWRTYQYILKKYRISGSVITTPTVKVPDIHKNLGWAKPTGKVFYVAKNNLWLQIINFGRLFQKINPDYVWVQEEPTEVWLLFVLAYYFFNRKVRVVSAVCQNIFRPASVLFQPVRKLLWSRLDGLASVANFSLEAIYKIGMPRNIPAKSLVAGCLVPPRHVTALKINLNKNKNDFVVGFVGRLVAEKGWQILLEALALLPRRFKLIMVTEGPDMDKLSLWLKKKSYTGRVRRLDFVPVEKLWRIYRNFDCLVLPSFDTPWWIEQFGGVLANAMAMGVVTIGSDSGGIPEVIGSSGLTFPQKNSQKLAQAIKKISDDKKLSSVLAEAGKKRFREEFTIAAYAKKIAALINL